MKVKDVPQDKDTNYEGHLKVRYGRNEEGSIVKVGSSGCKIEKQATSIAWDDINASLKNTYERAQSGEISPLVFHMEYFLMEPELLAKNIGYWVWKVKRHFKPEVFKKLDNNTLNTYATYFGISLEELKTLPEKH